MSVAAVDDRPLPYRMRRDLSFHPQRFSDRTEMGLKDPLALRYWQLREEEFFLLQSLDGETSLAQLQSAFSERFAPRRISTRQLNAFIGMLHREGLVTADRPGQGSALLERGRKIRRHKRREAFSNILALRFRGIDPQPLIDWLYPKLRWLFSMWAIAGGALLIAAAIVLLLSNFSQLTARLPEFQAFFQPRSLIWFMLAIAVTKVMHELGHGLTCKHFGGTCHELGFMLLVFAPCLYINVSDSWTFPSRWRRIAVSAAGIYVELIVAAVCTFLWWYSEPGVLNAIFLRVMLVCSISTIFLNGNPLLRYDGYFILSDLVNVPNLQQQSSAVVRAALSQLALGIAPVNPRLLPQRKRVLLAAYAIASFVYRVLIVIAILWFLHQALQPHGLQAVVHVLAVFVVVGMATGSATRIGRFIMNPARTRQVKWSRLTFVSIAATAVVIILLLIPMPHRVYVPAIVEPEGGRAVYVTVPGRLTETVTPDDRVARGTVIATLDSPPLRRELEQLAGRVEELRVELSTLKTRVAQQVGQASSALELQLPTIEQALADTVEQYKEKQAAIAKLTIAAPIDGTIFPPPRRTESADEEDLPDWSGSPLDRENVGAYMQTGTMLCLIGDPTRMRASLIVPQVDLESVCIGQAVRLQVDQLPGRSLNGEVAEIAEMDTEQLPSELLASGRLPSLTTEDGERRPLGKMYQVHVSIADHPPTLVAGAMGTARISARPKSLATRLSRFLASTFRFSPAPR